MIAIDQIEQHRNHCDDEAPSGTSSAMSETDSFIRPDSGTTLSTRSSYGSTATAESDRSIANFLRDPKEYLRQKMAKRVVYDKLQSGANKKYKHFLAAGMLLQYLSKRELQNAEYELLTCPAFIEKKPAEDIYALAKYDFDSVAILISNTKWLCQRYASLSEQGKNSKKGRQLCNVARKHIREAWNVVKDVLADDFNLNDPKEILKFYEQDLPSLAKAVSHSQEFYDVFMPVYQKNLQKLYEDNLWDPSIEYINKQIEKFVNPWARQDMRLTNNEYECLNTLLNRGIRIPGQASTWEPVFRDLSLMQSQSMWDRFTHSMLWYLNCSTNSFPNRVAEMLQQVKQYTIASRENYTRYGALRY